MSGARKETWLNNLLNRKGDKSELYMLLTFLLCGNSKVISHLLYSLKFVDVSVLKTNKPKEPSGNIGCPACQHRIN